MSGSISRRNKLGLAANGGFLEFAVEFFGEAELNDEIFVQLEQEELLDEVADDVLLLVTRESESVVSREEEIDGRARNHLHSGCGAG